MCIDPAQRKKPPRKPFKTFLFCCDCCSLVSGCIVVAFINIVIDLLFLGYSLYPFYAPRSFTIPVWKWTRECYYLAALPRYSDSHWDLERTRGANIMTYWLPVNPVLIVLFIVADILLFAGVTERKRGLITFSISGLLLQVLFYVENLVELLAVCSPKLKPIALKLIIIAWDIYSIAILYGYFIELSEGEEVRPAVAPDLPSELRRHIEYPVFDQDAEMIRPRPTQAQANLPKSEAKRDQKSVLHMLRPDILEMNDDISVQSLED